MKSQSPDQIVNIAGWEPASEYEGFFTKGSKAKSLLFCPDSEPFQFLIPKHYYMFKKSPHNYPHQFWIEIVAYYIGTLMSVPVPPAFVAFMPEDDTYGVLTEWFYNFPGEPVQLFIEGGDYMKMLIKGYDSMRGKQHNFKDMQRLLRFIKAEQILKDDWQAYWAKVFTFDAILGNRDRHHENWGLIWSINKEGGTKAQMSPVYDNESSLGHEIPEERLAEFENDIRIEKYINHPRKATHHMRWTIDSERIQFSDMVLKYIQEFPDTKAEVLSCLDFDITKLVKMLDNLVAFNIEIPLTQNRVNFMVRLIKKRQEDMQAKVNAL